MGTSAKKRPLPPEKLAARRKLQRERKARERAQAGGLAARRAQTKIEQLACLDWEKLQPQIHPIEHGVHAGCWQWRGGFHVVYGTVRPVVRAGQYGRQHADVAVYLVHHGRTELPAGAFLKRTCGNIRCVSPFHADLTNKVVEWAKKREKRAGGSHGLRKEQQGREGSQGSRQPQQGRLPRAV